MGPFDSGASQPTSIKVLDSPPNKSIPTITPIALASRTCLQPPRLSGPSPQKSTSISSSRSLLTQADTIKRV